MTFPFDAVRSLSFVGGPVCGALYEPRGARKLPKCIPIEHHGKLYWYTLHFKRRRKRTMFSYRLKCVMGRV